MGGNAGSGAAIVQMGDTGGGNSTRGAESPANAMATPTTYGGPTSSSDDEWKFEYHGYFRAPMRIGMGERTNAKTDQAKTTLSQPQVPDDQYLDWQYTKTTQRAWAETFFSYGNKWAKGTLSISAFSFTDAAWKDDGAQFGINQGWVTLDPDVSSIDEDMRLQIKVGSFWGRYGGAGRYDAGFFDSFIIGRTHTIGEAARVEYDYDDIVFHVEEGFGVKEPNPDPNHSTKFTLLAHAHAGFNWDEFLQVTGHVMHTWNQEPDHECISREEQWQIQGGNEDLASNPTRLLEVQAEFSDAAVGACKGEGPLGVGSEGPPLDGYVRMDSPDGSMTVTGIDAVLYPGVFGRVWMGYSHLSAEHAVTLAPALEVIHANGGGFFKSGITHQYFLEHGNWENNSKMNVLAEAGNGTIDTIAGQWNVSLSSLIGPELFGQQDLRLEAAFMLNLIQSEDDTALENISKLKYGGDLQYSPLSWMGVALRGTRVQPRSDVPEQSFSTLGPRLVFRSDFGTHEEINVGWSHYFYAQRECDDFQGNGYLYCVQPPVGTVGGAGFNYRPGVNASTAQRGWPVEPSSTTAPYPDQSWDPPHENTFYIEANIWW
jgi:hypothetical protein